MSEYRENVSKRENHIASKTDKKRCAHFVFDVLLCGRTRTNPVREFQTISEVFCPSGTFFQCLFTMVYLSPRASIMAFILTAFCSVQWLLFPVFLHLQLSPLITAWQRPPVHTRSFQLNQRNHRCSSRNSCLYAKVVKDDISSSEPSILPTDNDDEDEEEEEEEENMENTWDAFFEESAASKTGQKFLRDSDLDQNRDLDLILTERAERYSSSFLYPISTHSTY